MLRGLLVSLFTGVIGALGWSVLVDANVNTLDKFEWVHIVPCLLATAAAVAIAVTPIHRVSELTEVRVWLFVWLTIALSAIGGSIWILATEYAPPVAVYPGLSILLQTISQLTAGFLFFVGKHSTEEGWIRD
jgi:hypothetical protein